MNLSGDVFFDTVTEVNRISTGAFQVPNYKVYNRDYSWVWNIGNNFAPAGDLIIYDLDAQNIYQTVSIGASYGTNFRQPEIFFDEDLTFMTTLFSFDDIRSTISGTSYYFHYVKIDLDPDTNFDFTVTDLGRADDSSSNGSTYIIDYDKVNEMIYILSVGSSGNFGNSGMGSRFIKYDIDAQTNSFYSQDWRGNTPSITGGGFSQNFPRRFNIDLVTEEVIFIGADQEVGSTQALYNYSYKNDVLTQGDPIRELPDNNNPQRNSIFYHPISNTIDIPYTNWVNQDNNINIRSYSADTMSLLGEILSTDNTFFSYVGIINYNPNTKNYEVIGNNTFNSNVRVFELAIKQKNNNIPLESGEDELLFDDDRFIILATASTASIFGTSGFVSGGNIDTMGVDEARDRIYLLVNGQPAGSEIKLIETDLNFNLLDTYDIEIEGNYQSADLRESKGIYDTQSSTIYTALRDPSNRVLGKIEIDHATLSSSTVSTIANYSSTVGNGTFVYMLGIVDDVLYWNHGYEQIQVGKETYFRAININTDVEVSGVFTGTYSHITNFYFDQDALKVYYMLNVDNIRYVYDYNTLTQSVINPYPNTVVPDVVHKHLPSGENPDKLVGYPNSNSTFKEVTVNYVSNTYMTNIDTEFGVGLNIEYISNDILYGYSGDGTLYKVRKK